MRERKTASDRRWERRLKTRARARVLRDKVSAREEEMRRARESGEVELIQHAGARLASAMRSLGYFEQRVNGTVKPLDDAEMAAYRAFQARKAAR